MKKSLLLALVMATGIQAVALGPTLFGGPAQSFKLSTSGEWLVGYSPDGTYLELNNLKTGLRDFIFITDESEYLTMGYGNAIADDGSFVLSTSYDGTPAYYNDGDLFELPLPENCTSGYAEGISRDGSIIVGSVGIDWAVASDLGLCSLSPAIWVRGENGEYGEAQLLKYPSKDLLGLSPQWVNAMYITDDCKTIVGQMLFDSGMNMWPLIFTQNESGEWEGEFLCAEAFNPEGIELPEIGDKPKKPNATDYMSEASAEAYNAAMAAALTEPKATDFMDEDQKAAYLEALAQATYYVNPYSYMTEEQQEAYSKAQNDYWTVFFGGGIDPQPYMTEEEYAAYEEAKTAYDEAKAEYDEIEAELSDAYIDLLLTGSPMFMQNVLSVSPNGLYVGTSGSEIGVDGEDLTETYSVYLFNLAEKEMTVLESEPGTSPNLTMLTNSGQALAVDLELMDMFYLFEGYISPSEGAAFVTLGEYFAEKAPLVYQWMDENMTHTVEVIKGINSETGTPIIGYEEDHLVSGMPLGISEDGKYMVTCAMNVWDEEIPTDSQNVPSIFYTYVLPLDDSEMGIESVSTNSNLIVGLDGMGVLTIVGEQADVTIYDLNGREMFRVNGAEGSVNTGLVSGAYVVRAENGRGVTVAKGIVR